MSLLLLLANTPPGPLIPTTPLTRAGTVNPRPSNAGTIHPGDQ